MCFSDLTKTLTLAFGGHYLRGVFQTSCVYDHAQSLSVIARFYDPDLISRSRICQNHELQIAFRFLFTVGSFLVS